MRTQFLFSLILYTLTHIYETLHYGVNTIALNAIEDILIFDKYNSTGVRDFTDNIQNQCYNI